MTGLLSYVPVVNRFVGGAQRQSIDLDPVEIHHIEDLLDKRARRLKHLLKANHANYSIIYHNLQFDNHNPHILSSAYLLGANEDQLHDIYDEQIKELEPWQPSPAEIIDEDWRDFLGDKRYQRAYIDFFEDNAVMEFSYDWEKVLEEYLYSGDEPLVHGLIGGLGHPLIHLAYAYEIDCKEVGMEALGLACVQYNFLHKYLDDKSYTRPSPLASGTSLELLQMLSNDARFEALPKDPAFGDMEQIFNQHGDLILEYWNAWKINDPLEKFELSQEAAVAILVATVRPGTHAYNFFLVHILTTSHALRVLLPHIPTKYHISLVRGWWLLVLAVFIIKGRPQLDPDNVDLDVKGKTWKYVEDKALNSEWRKDAHYVKAVRAMKEAARTWGDVHGRYLASAVAFVDNFHGWTF